MNSAPQKTPFLLRLRRGLMRRIGRLLYSVLARVEVHGLENIPRGTAYLAALNHTSIFDAPLMLAVWPESIAAIGAADVFDKPLQGQIVALYGTTKVHRGAYDRALIDDMLETLAAGTPVLIAPEGGRSHEPAMRRAKPGIAYIVEQAGVPVVPVGVTGVMDDFLKRGLRLERPHVAVRIGPPFRLPPLEGRGEDRRAARQHNADLVMRHIAEVLPPEYHGVYAEGRTLEPT